MQEPGPYLLGRPALPGVPNSSWSHCHILSAGSLGVDRNSGVRRVRHTWFKGCNFVGIAESWEVPILRCHPQTLASAAP